MILDQNKIKAVCEKAFPGTSTSFIKSVINYNTLYIKENTPYGDVTLMSFCIAEFGGTNNLLFHAIGEYKEEIKIHLLKELARSQNAEGLFIFLIGIQPLYKRLLAEKIQPIYKVTSKRTRNLNSIFYIKLEE
jgi:hypothetical protein